MKLMGMVNWSQMFKDKFGSSRSTSSAECDQYVGVDSSLGTHRSLCSVQKHSDELWLPDVLDFRKLVLFIWKKGLLCNSSRNKKKDEMSHRGLIDLLEICRLLHFLNKQWVWPWLLLRVYSMTRHICWEKNKQTKKTGKPNGHWRRFPLNRHGYCSYPLKKRDAGTAKPPG